MGGAAGSGSIIVESQVIGGMGVGLSVGCGAHKNHVKLIFKHADLVSQSRTFASAKRKSHSRAVDLVWI